MLKKVGTPVKTGISGADVVIGTNHVLEDFACNAQSVEQLML